MNFIAIDFETANAKRSSACSVGLTDVSAGVITKTVYHLIKPTPFEFNPFNVRIHGITEDDVKDAPNIFETLDSIIGTITRKVLVAHNAAFDISVIRNALDLEELPYPSMEYLCTYRLAQIVLPNLVCYRLDYLCNYFGIPLKHHSAESDSMACAELFLKLAEVAECATVSALVEKTQIQKGMVYFDHYIPCTCSNTIRKRKAHKKQTIGEINNLAIQYPDSDFVDKYFAFTGTLMSMSRERALELVSIAGGIAQDSVTKKTNYLVSGYQNEFALKGEKTSRKFKKAMLLAQSGCSIQIIQEEDFLGLIDNQLWEAFLETKKA